LLASLTALRSKRTVVKSSPQALIAAKIHNPHTTKVGRPSYPKIGEISQIPQDKLSVELAEMSICAICDCEYIVDLELELWRTVEEEEG
jgi:hypothetical protein